MMKRKPSLGRKLKIFFKEHWVTITIVAGVILLVILSIIGLMSLESFYMKLTLAQAPISLLLGMINAAIFVFMYLTFFRKGMSSSKKNKIKPTDTNITFKHVLGIEEAKQEALEVVELINDQKKVQKIGGRTVKGMLMIGPPGCGKTLLAKAIATETGVPFLSMAGSEFVEMFVGVGAKRVRDLFEQARNVAYANGGCIVFIDEVDVVGQKREFAGYSGGGGEERRSTLNQLLVEMDGLVRAHKDEMNITVIGATNAPEESLDPALLRPGRFDRIVYINLPSVEGREKIIEFYLKSVQCDSDINIPRLARILMGKSPAQIENTVKEAALIAVREGDNLVSHRHISAAIERIELGMKHKRSCTDQELEMTAWHETGHLVTSYICHPTNDVFKASIVPRKQTLGVVYHHPREEVFSYNKDKWLADICVCLGGYVAEKIKYGRTTQGVISDFQKATHLANTMVWRLGMSLNESTLGDYTSIPKECRSEDLKKRLNNEVDKILQTCAKNTEDLLRKNWTVVEHFVRELLEKEELEYNEIQEIFNSYNIMKHGENIS